MKLKTKFLLPTIFLLSILLIVGNPLAVFSQILDMNEESVDHDHDDDIPLGLYTGKALTDELDEIKKEIENNKNRQKQIQNEKAQLSNNLTSYQQQIVDLQNKALELTTLIEQKELEIRQLEIEIQLLEAEIKKLEIEIEDAKDQISALEDETDGRLLNMYLAQKQNQTTSAKMFSSGSPSSFVKNDTYRQALQEDTNDKLNILEATREQLEKDQEKLVEDKITIDRNRQTIIDEKVIIDIQRTQAKDQRAAFEAKKGEAASRQSGLDELAAVLSKEEKDLLNQQDKVQSALLARNEVSNGLPVEAGTFLGIEGDTGYSYGAHLHFGVSENGAIKNPCSYLPGGSYGSCGGSGKIRKPLGGVLTSGFRTKSRPNHNAIDISTGGGGSVVAAHNGYAYFFFEPCPSWAPVCNNGGAIVAKVCETDGCSSGLATVYYHLSCTAEPSSSPRSCKR